MATEVIKHAVKYRCDAASCAFVALVEADDTPPKGYHGLVQRVAEFGATDKVVWFSCSQKHIEAAVLYALDAANH